MVTPAACRHLGLKVPKTLVISEDDLFDDEWSSD